jgi:ribosomal protein L37AE/L43A
MIMVLWVMVDIILLVIFLVTKKKGRECPACGRKVKVGLTKCEKCGHDFVKA